MSAEPVDGIQYPYLATLYLTTSENIKLYNETIFGLPESNRYDLTISKWTGFYQELEDDLFIFGFKAAVLIVASIYINQSTTGFKNFILLYPSITQAMAELYCEKAGFRTPSQSRLWSSIRCP